MHVMEMENVSTFIIIIYLLIYFLLLDWLLCTRKQKNSQISGSNFGQKLLTLCGATDVTELLDEKIFVSPTEKRNPE